MDGTKVYIKKSWLQSTMHKVSTQPNKLLKKNVERKKQEECVGKNMGTADK